MNSTYLLLSVSLVALAAMLIATSALIRILNRNIKNLESNLWLERQTNILLEVQLKAHRDAAAIRKATRGKSS